MTEALRQYQTLSYRTLVKSMMVTALRNVYTSNFYEPQFENLKIFTQFNLAREAFPQITVKYNGSTSAGGVGHEEQFSGADGVFRVWDHRMFHGSFTFTVYALSPLDRDILLDSLEEIVAFGRLDPEMENFYTTIYGTPGVSQYFVLNQLALNSDEISSFDEGGVTPAPWNSEDSLLYTGTLSVNCFGGFYNTQHSVPLDWVWSVTVTPYIQGEQVVNTDITWWPPFVYYDDAETNLPTGTGAASGTNSYIPGPYGVQFFGIGVISGIDRAIFLDSTFVSTPTGVGIAIDTTGFLDIAPSSGSVLISSTGSYTSTTLLTLSGNEITDAVRTTATQGDGLATGSGVGVWEATTNLCDNGGFETGLGSWVVQGTATISQDATWSEFGTKSMKVQT